MKDDNENLMMMMMALTNCFCDDNLEAEGLTDMRQGVVRQTREYLRNMKELLHCVLACTAGTKS
jgi:hypothetical protein